MNSIYTLRPQASTRDSVPLILFLSRLTGRDVYHLRPFDRIFERRRVLVRRWSDSWQRHGKRSDCDFFIRSPPSRPFSTRFSSTVHEFCIQHRGQEEQQNDAYAYTDDNSGVPAVGSIPILNRGLVTLCQGMPSLASALIKNAVVETERSRDQQ